MRKILLGAGAALVVGLGVALWLLLSNLDSLVASVIEEQGSRVTGTAVRVGKVSIDLRAGSGTIRGLRVANPKGFSRGDAFQLGEITLDLDTGSLTSSPIVVQRIRVAAPVARYEVDARGRSNFGVIREHAARAGGGEARSEPASEGASGPPLELVIQDFAFEKGAVRADFSALDPSHGPIELALPSVHRRNIGAPAGATAGQVGKEVVAAFGSAVIKAVAAQQAAKRLEKALGGRAGKAASGLLEKALR